MTVFIANVFFPNGDRIMSLLATTATFGVAFFMRPLGGLMIGLYADKYGRKSAITAVIVMMGLAMCLISFTPSYASIGITAPLLIVLARLVQGFSTGGEFCSSMAILIELSPDEKRGFYGSWQMVGQVLAMLAGSTVGLWLTLVFTPAQIEAWAWRIPFLIGLIIVPVGFHIRRNLIEPPRQGDQRPNPSSFYQVLQRLSDHRRSILVAMGLVVGGTVAVYINISYIPTFMATYFHMPLHQAYFSVSLSALLMVFIMPFLGSLSDRIGRKSILMPSLMLYLALIYPLFSWMVATPDFWHLLVVEMISCILLAAFFSVFAVIIAELFARDIRSTGLGISYNLTVMLFGGTAQVAITGIIHYFQSPFAITWYLLFAMSISLIAGFFYRDPRRHYFPKQERQNHEQPYVVKTPDCL
jgi:MFS family permease